MGPKTLEWQAADHIDRLRAQIDRLRAQDDAIRAEFGGKRDGRPTIECVREAFAAKWSTEDTLFQATLDMKTQELRSEVARLKAENEKLRAATQWQPIEVEPGKTMRVLLFRPSAYHPDWDGADYGISVGYFSNGEWRDQGTNHDAFEYEKPNHWMPLPPPPENKSDESPEGKAAIEGAHEASKP